VALAVEFILMTDFDDLPNGPPHSTLLLELFSAPWAHLKIGSRQAFHFTLWPTQGAALSWVIFHD